MMEPWQWFVSASVGLLSFGYGMIRYQHGLTEGVRKECAARIDALGDRESKARHDLHNQTQVLVGKVEIEVKSARDAIDRLRGDTVRREDHNALETRLTAQIGKVETKVDGLVKDTAAIPSIARAVDGLVSKMDQLMSRNGSD